MPLALPLCSGSHLLAASKNLLYGSPPFFFHIVHLPPFTSFLPLACKYTQNFHVLKQTTRKIIILPLLFFSSTSFSFKNGSILGLRSPSPHPLKSSFHLHRASKTTLNTFTFKSNGHLTSFAIWCRWHLPSLKLLIHLVFMIPLSSSSCYFFFVSSVDFFFFFKPLPVH